MINNATKYAVSDIFGIENQIKYIIPKYQREYTWGRENWSNLLDDISESENSHYIGSIICIKTDADTLKPELELVDGQQRLTTLSLLFLAIYESMDRLKMEGNIDLELLKFQIINRRTGEPKIRLSKQNNNNSDFLSILHDLKMINFPDYDNNKNKGNRIIYKCYRYFLDKLSAYGYDELKNIKEKINQTLLVKIEVDSHSDAFVLFESLNNRGVPLSAIDLIKNKILAEFDHNQSEITIDDAFEKWNGLIKNLPDYAMQERFLRQYYNAFKIYGEIKIDGITKATRSSLIKIYETLIKRSAEKIFLDLIDKSIIYHNLINPDDAMINACQETKNELIDLINVKAAPSYALLLFLLSEYQSIDVSEFKKIVRFLVKYFIRRNVTDFPNTRNLDKIFIDLIKRIKEVSVDNVYSEIKKYLKNENRMSTDEIFRDKLEGNLYDFNIDATRFILSKIEQTKTTKEIYLDFWARDKSNKLIWTIEHIFPEGKNIPQDWVNMIANGDKSEAIDIQEKYVHKLGNLTLTGFNQNLSNFPFEEKRDRKNREGNFIGYKNGLFLNKELRVKNKWSKEDIKQRTEKLVELAMDIFAIK